jgi:hypothetical protein
MYYEEIDICGIPHCRTNPQGAWKKVDYETLSERIAFANKKDAPVVDHASELAEALRALLGVSHFSVIAVQAEDTIAAYEDSLK